MRATRNYTLNQGLRLYEKDASDTKLLCTTRLSKKIPRLTSKTIYPNSFPRLIHTIDVDHSNDRYQNIKRRLSGNNFFPSTTTLWNNLPENILSRNDTNPSPFFHNGSRKAQIIHCKLRLGMSDLNQDPLNRHLKTNSSCDCGERK